MVTKLKFVERFGEGIYYPWKEEHGETDQYQDDYSLYYQQMELDNLTESCGIANENLLKARQKL